MKSLKWAVGAMAVAMSLGASAATLDSFTDTQSVFRNTIGTWDENQVNDAVGSIFGGYREIGVLKVSDNTGIIGGSPARTVQSDVNVSPGLYTFSSSVGTVGVGKIRYDGAATMGMNNGPDFSTDLGSLLSLGAGVQFTYDTDLAFSVVIDIYDTSGNVLTGGFLATPNPNPVDFLSEILLWTDLDPNAGGAGQLIDWNHIGAIDVTLNGLTQTTRIDLSVAAVTSVPEPTVLGLLGIALLGLGLSRKRQA